MTPFVLSISENSKLSVFIYCMRMLDLSIANVVHWLCIGVGNPLLEYDTELRFVKCNKNYFYEKLLVRRKKLSAYIVILFSAH